MLLRKVHIPIAALLLLLTVLTHAAAPLVSAAEADCGLLLDCTFDDFYGNAGAGSGPWKIFKIAGTSGFSLAPSEGWPKGPSVKVSSEGGYDAGIYQQVSVTPGTAYRFSIPFAVVNISGQGWHEGDQVSRKMGIDPFGRTDASSGSITWSADYFGKGRFNDDELQVSEYARSTTITVFIRVIDPYTDRHVDVFLDSPNLQANADMPPIQIAPPTSIPLPPAAANTPRATPRPTLAPSPESAATPTPELTDSPTLTPTEEPTQSAEPSDTPTRIPTRLRPTMTPTLLSDAGPSTRVLALTIGGAAASVGLVGAALLLTLAFVYWRRSKS